MAQNPRKYHHSKRQNADRRRHDENTRKILDPGSTMQSTRGALRKSTKGGTSR